ncbi:MAG TPA: ATP-dependent DNA ligase [Haloplasmataceae bacterium]
MSNDVFIKRLASPMLLVEGEPFDSKDFIYELKLDGIRCLAYLDDYTELRNKRNKDVTFIYPELKRLYKQVNKRCILDGELIITVNGVPDFFEIQRRSLMTNPYKISIASKSKPVSFVCYDILYYDDKEVNTLPLEERKDLLSKNVIENETLAISRFIEEKGIAFYQLAVKKNLEGVVAKRKTSLYYYGKRSKEWIKFKWMYDDDFIICGYVRDEKTNGIKSLVLGAYIDKQLVYQGHVSLGIPKQEEKIIIDFVNSHLSTCPFSENHYEQVIWCEPHLVCTIKYMMKTPHNTLRQPVYKGLRTDKTPIDCQNGGINL